MCKDEQTKKDIKFWLNYIFLILSLCILWGLLYFTSDIDKKWECAKYLRNTIIVAIVIELLFTIICFLYYFAPILNELWSPIDVHLKKCKGKSKMEKVEKDQSKLNKNNDNIKSIFGLLEIRIIDYLKEIPNQKRYTKNDIKTVIDRYVTEKRNEINEHAISTNDNITLILSEMNEKIIKSLVNLYGKRRQKYTEEEIKAAIKNYIKHAKKEFNGEDKTEDTIQNEINNKPNIT